MLIIGQREGSKMAACHGWLVTSGKHTAVLQGAWGEEIMQEGVLSR